MIGRRLSHYEIVSQLGKGGMGEVYLGKDPRLRRRVAIKAVHERLLVDPGSLARFRREARTLAALNHPNIAGIYDIVEQDGRYFLVLEFVDGESLSERIAQGPIHVERTLEVGIQVADGLAAAHDAGFIHRDLKPSNIHMTAAGTVKILDFGLARLEPTPEAKAPEGGTTEPIGNGASTPGAIVGTLAYMSPEQARGESLDRRTDTWSFGILLYQMLTGTNPFSRGSAAECMAATLSESVDLDRLPSSTPPEVIALIRRCLAKDRQRRQRDAADCALILREALDALAEAPAESTWRNAIANRSLRIDDDICRTLNRSDFDALLPGWQMLYADNDRDSDTLIVWVPSIGGDHTTTQWRDLIAASPYRMVIATPVGMEPGVETWPVVSIENQFALIRALVRYLRKTIRPDKTVISGFACGSIIALRCAAGDESEELFDGVLAIDADLQESDCFLTRLFAGLEANSTQDVVKGLSQLSSSCGSVHQWLTLHQHMIESVHKVQNDFSPLVRQGRDLSRDYEGVRSGADSPFVGYLRDALARVGTVRCVFNEGKENRRIIGEIRMMHLDKGALGPRFTDEVIEFLPVPDQDGMMKNERLLEQLERIVASIQR